MTSYNDVIHGCHTIAMCLKQIGEAMLVQRNISQASMPASSKVFQKGAQVATLHNKADFYPRVYNLTIYLILFSSCRPASVNNSDHNCVVRIFVGLRNSCTDN